MSGNPPVEIGKIQELISDFLADKKVEIDNVDKATEALGRACREIDRSWSQSDIGSHGLFYYGNFEIPAAEDQWDAEWGTIHGVPEGWSEKTEDEVKAEMLKRSGGIDIPAYSDSVERLYESIENLKSDVGIEIVSVEARLNERDRVLAKEIENFDFGDLHQLRADDINSRHGGQRMSRDSRNLMRGRTIPGHHTAASTVTAIREILNRLRVYEKLVGRFVRQVSRSQGNIASTPAEPTEPLEPLFTLLRRFHTLAQALLNRHDKRQTLEINDEYDVQDLLGAFLRIEFDDVRPEDVVSQYAGSTSRVDFVLKKERTVVEVKKTSSKLRDKELGEQLILDIAHYAKHPDCETLVCFVYDPEGRVRNRAGLIHDLESHEGKLRVKIIFCP